MKLSNLRYFVKVAQYGSLSEAAKRLFISQPTLSRRIQELEEEMGVPLFIRQLKGMKLTANGQILYDHSVKLLADIDELPTLFQHQKRSQKKDIIHIGYQRHFYADDIFRIVEILKEENPSNDFIVSEATPIALQEGLNKGQFDLIFGVNIFFKDNEQWVILPYQHNILQLVIPKNHRLSKKEKVTFEDLRYETVNLLNRRHSPIIIDYVLSQCLKNGFSLNVNHYIDHYQDGIHNTALGKGLSFIHSGMHGKELEEKFPVLVKNIVVEDDFFSYVVAYRKDSNNLLLGKFIDTLMLEALKAEK